MISIAYLFQISFGWIIQNWTEILAVLSGIVGVWLTTRQNIWNWPMALINVFLYLYIFWNAKFYAGAGLQVFYIVITVYGWYNWLHGGENKSKLKVRHIVKNEIIIHLSLGLTLPLIMGYFLSKTDATFPYLDSIECVWAILCTFMMAKKIIENWLVWIIINSFCVVMYFVRGLYPTSFLFALYATLAIVGYISWLKDYKTNCIETFK